MEVEVALPLKCYTCIQVLKLIPEGCEICTGLLASISKFGLGKPKLDAEL